MQYIFKKCNSELRETLVTGGVGKWIAGGTLACSGLKEAAMDEAEAARVIRARLWNLESRLLCTVVVSKKDGWRFRSKGVNLTVARGAHNRTEARFADEDKSHKFALISHFIFSPLSPQSRRYSNFQLQTGVYGYTLSYHDFAVLFCSIFYYLFFVLYCRIFFR